MVFSTIIIMYEVKEIVGLEQETRESLFVDTPTHMHKIIHTKEGTQKKINT